MRPTSSKKDPSTAGTAISLRRFLFSLTTTLLMLGLLSGCSARINALAPKGEGAARIADLTWFLFGVGGAVYLIVMGFLLLALFRSRREHVEPRAAEPRSNDGRRIIIFGGIVFPAVILAGTYAFTLYTLSALSPPEDLDTDLVIEVVGHQWWWEVRYPNQDVVTANEIHIPVGRPVEIILSSDDVIHSFWVPELHGKLDLNPGDVNSMWLEANEAGVYWGKCAEFCGIQHAKMQFVVVAEPADRLAAWLDQQSRPAPEPATPLVQEGQQIFLGSSCVYCHAIRGTNASGTLGPDLTHIASRMTLGAGILPNTRGNLAGWTIDSHSVKPGNLMPPMDLSGPELQALLAYLETLE